MRVERARSEESDMSKTTKTSNANLQSAAGTSAPKAPEGANQGAFSKVLDVARENSDNGRNEKQAGDSKSETSADKTAEGKKEGGVEAKAAKRDDQKHSSGENDRDENSGFVPAPISVPDRSSDSNATAPPARAILHVADLERIVSSVRSDSFAGTKQVTIDLKNSVLDGLKIQLTLTEQGNLKAEFIAQSEQVKKQLEVRRNELQSILKDRSIKCGELNIRVFVPGEDRARQAREFDESSDL